MRPILIRPRWLINKSKRLRWIIIETQFGHEIRFVTKRNSAS